VWAVWVATLLLAPGAGALQVAEPGVGEADLVEGHLVEARFVEESGGAVVFDAGPLGPDVDLSGAPALVDLEPALAQADGVAFVAGAPSALGTWSHIVHALPEHDEGVASRDASFLAGLGVSPGGLAELRIDVDADPGPAPGEAEGAAAEEGPDGLEPRPASLALLGALAAGAAALRLGRLR
jgi:hypothetical protein